MSLCSWHHQPAAGDIGKAMSGDLSAAVNKAMEKGQ